VKGDRIDLGCVLMRISRLEAIFRALNESGAEYLIVGGMAVIAHGHVRLTNDLDLVLNLSSAHLSDALESLHALDFRPRIPVKLVDFADHATRTAWRDEKKMVVFSLFNLADPELIIDLFVTEPFDFADEYRRAMWQTFGENIRVPVISLDTLMSMKREAGRPHDLIDLEKLATIRSIQDENA
jgi:hypothetical protein